MLALARGCSGGRVQRLEPQPRRPSLTRCRTTTRINEIGDRAGAKVVTAKVPLADMFGYATDLRNLSSGRASFTMQFDHYEPVPKNIEEKVVGERMAVTSARG